MDAVHPGHHLPLLRFNRGDEGVEALPPWTLINEVWPEPPPTDRIHLFVTFTDRESPSSCLPIDLSGNQPC